MYRGGAKTATRLVPPGTILVAVLGLGGLFGGGGGGVQIWHDIPMRKCRLYTTQG